MLFLSTLVLIACFFFAEDIKDAIVRIFSKTWNWVKGDEPANPTDIIISLLLLAGLGFVIRGNYSFINYSLGYVLPIENPEHITRSMVVLAVLMGILLHKAERYWKILPALFSLAVVALFGYLGYSQVYEDLSLNEGPIDPTPAFSAGLQFSLMSMMEVAVCWGVFSTAKNSIAFLWLLLLSPLWLIYLLAWLATLAKKAPQKLMSWKAAYWQHKTRQYLENAPLRQELVVEKLLDEPRETEKQRVEDYNAMMRRIGKGHFDTISSTHKSTFSWLQFYGWFYSLSKSLEGAKTIYHKILNNIHHSFDEVLERSRMRFCSNGKSKDRTVEKEITLIALILTLLLSQSVYADRFTLLYLDITSSYPYTTEAGQHISKHIIPNMAPGDKAAFFKMGNFAEQASQQLHFPTIAPEVFQKELWPNFFAYKSDKVNFDKVWTTTERLQQQAQKWLLDEVAMQDGGCTQFYDMLSYASIQLGELGGGDKYFLVFSDLLNEAKGQDKSKLPPSTCYDFSDCHVAFLFVPYENYDEWLELNDAWQSYFQQAKASSFKMLNVSSSTMATDVLPKNPIPRQFPRFKMER
jgi:hypothetical protein